MYVPGLQKAFDAVPHRRLLHKIESYGVTGNALKWVTDFLSNRSQYVALNGVASEDAPVTSGVPQGSVLGPTLFIYYINDLPEVVDSLIKIFADDTKSYDKVESVNDHQKLQVCIDNLVKCVARQENQSQVTERHFDTGRLKVKIRSKYQN